MKRPITSPPNRAHHALAAVALAVGAALPMGLHAQGDGAARWAALAKQSPCDWLPPETMATIVGSDAKPQLRVTKADTGCSWRTARGNPVLTASLVQWTSVANLVAERDTLLQQIAQYGGDRFTKLPSPGGVVTAVLRKDRGRATVFPNGSGSVAAISVNPHVVMKETEPEKDVRRQRAVAFIDALVKKHGL